MYKKNAFAFVFIMIFSFLVVVSEEDDNAKKKNVTLEVTSKKNDTTVQSKSKKNPPPKFTGTSKTKTRMVKIKNNITPEMTRYRFWGTYYSPTHFYLTAENKNLKPNDVVECAVNDKNKIEVTYHYEFKNGMVTGSKCIEFEIPEKALTQDTPISITFSWDKKHRLISSCGRAVCAKQSVLKSSCSFV